MVTKFLSAILSVVGVLFLTCTNVNNSQPATIHVSIHWPVNASPDTVRMTVTDSATGKTWVSTSLFTDHEVSVSGIPNNIAATITIDGIKSDGADIYHGVVSVSNITDGMEVPLTVNLVVAGLSPIVKITNPSADTTVDSATATITISGTIKDTGNAGIDSLVVNKIDSTSSMNATRSIFSVKFIIPKDTDTVIVTAWSKGKAGSDTVIFYRRKSSVKHGLDSGLVAYFPFNGNANDMSGNGNNGSVTGATLTTDRFNNANKAYLFAGTTSSYISGQANNFPLGNKPRSLSAWIYPMAFPSGTSSSYFFMYGEQNASLHSNLFYACIRSYSDTINLCMGIDYPDLYKVQALNLNTWYFVTADWDGTTARLYLNGNLLDSGVITPATLAGEFIIGRSSGDFLSGEPFNGKIDDIRFYSRSLLPSEVDSLYNEDGWTGNPTTSTDTVMDRDLNVYHTVRIGTQTWMVENLKTTKYNDGTAIPLVTDNGIWGGLSTSGYCWYNNDTTNKNPYGALYNWNAVNTGKLAPLGWHVPSDSEWSILVAYVGGDVAAGGALKEAGIAHWGPPNTGATNNPYGFSALPGGYRQGDNGMFFGIGDEGNWWSSPANFAPSSWNRIMLYDTAYVYRNYDSNDGVDGFSVRCVSDH